MDLQKNMIRGLLSPSFHYLRGWKDRLEYHRFLNEREFCSVNSNISIQKERLFRLVNYAIQQVPYYKRIAELNNIKCNVKTIFEDIKCFPILTKDIIRENYDELLTIEKRKGIYSTTSGGSTGIPIILKQDKEYLMQDSTLCFDGFMGYELGDKLVRLWGSERDIIQGSESFIRRALNKLYYRTLFLNSFKMSEKDMDNFVQKINQFQPEYMVAYVQSAYELAKYIQRNNKAIYKMKGILVSAGTLYDDFRSESVV